MSRCYSRTLGFVGGGQLRGFAEHFWWNLSVLGVRIRPQRPQRWCTLHAVRTEEKRAFRWPSVILFGAAWWKACLFSGFACSGHPKLSW